MCVFVWLRVCLFVCLSTRVFVCVIVCLSVDVCLLAWVVWLDVFVLVWSFWHLFVFSCLCGCVNCGCYVLSFG